MQVDDAVLLPRGHLPLMVGSTGSRVLAAALPHVDAWNTWFDWFGNTPGGFAARNAEVDDLARRAGRDPDSLERSACLLVALDPSSGSGRSVGPAGDRTSGAIADAIRAMAEAGAHE